MTAALRIAIIGAGAIGRQHVQRVLKNGDCRLTAIVDPAPGAADIAKKAGVTQFGSLADLLARERPDGVILGLPASRPTFRR